MSWVAILMAAEGDWADVEPAWSVLTDLGVETEMRVLSAHHGPEQVASYVKDAQERDCSVFVCAADPASHLAVAVASHSARPVISLPVAAVQMPEGVPLAVVAGQGTGAANAGYLAAQMLGLADGPLFGRLQQRRKDSHSKVERLNKKLQATIKQASG